MWKSPSTFAQRCQQALAVGADLVRPHPANTAQGVGILRHRLRNQAQCGIMTHHVRRHLPLARQFGPRDPQALKTLLRFGISLGAFI
jgi:hypothetical protein